MLEYLFKFCMSLLTPRSALDKVTCRNGPISGRFLTSFCLPVFCGTVTNPSLGVHEMKIGSVTIQIKTGDITKEGAEVIVNSSNNNFTLHSGDPSKSFQSVIREVDAGAGIYQG